MLTAATTLTGQQVSARHPYTLSSEAHSNPTTHLAPQSTLDTPLPHLTPQNIPPPAPTPPHPVRGLTSGLEVGFGLYMLEPGTKAIRRVITSPSPVSSIAGSPPSSPSAAPRERKPPETGENSPALTPPCSHPPTLAAQSHLLSHPSPRTDPYHRPFTIPSSRFSF